MPQLGTIVALFLLLMNQVVTTLMKASVHSLTRQPASSTMAWKQYFVEFRGVQPYLRVDEFIDACGAVLQDAELGDEVRRSMKTVIKDPLNENYDPICAYALFPSINQLREVVARCSVVHSAIEVWGDASTIEDANLQAEACFQEKIKPHFIDEHSSQNSWRVNFRRFGRTGGSGLMAVEKQIVLEKFGNLLRKIKGKVDLQNPAHTFVLLEDWSKFHEEVVIAKDLTKGYNASRLDLDKEFIASRVIFGLKVEQGPKIESKFEVRSRPYVGTTAMDAVSSHIAANAAYVVPGNLVLDPFCGTGSLLLSAAYLGASVVGSDIDKDCLGLLNTTNVPYKERSKNSRFKRKMGDREWEQLNSSTPMNFDFYGLRDKLVELIDCSVEAWQNNSNINLLKYDKFDSIITDPPFGRRERTKYDSQEAYNKIVSTGLNGFHQDSTFVIVTLFRVAQKRLKRGGRLVFWFPTEAFLTQEQVRDILKTYESYAEMGISNDIVFERAKKQELNFGVWRWLVVYKRAS